MTIFDFVIVREAARIAFIIGRRGVAEVLHEIRHERSAPRHMLRCLISAQRIADANMEPGCEEAVSAIARAIEQLKAAGVSPRPLTARQELKAQSQCPSRHGSRSPSSHQNQETHR